MEAKNITTKTECGYFSFITKVTEKSEIFFLNIGYYEKALPLLLMTNTEMKIK